MTRYFIDYPRDFCNTYAVYAVALEDVQRFRAAFPDAEPISRARAIEMGWTRVREAKRDGEYWPAGFAGDGRTIDHPTSIADALTQCREATIRAIEEAEERKESSAWAMSET